MRGTLAWVMALPLLGCAPSTPPVTAPSSGNIIATGTLHWANGSSAGDVSITEAGDGSLHLSLQLSGWPMGVHGMHIHSIGRCDAPDFTSAGPHWNPAARQHGLHNPAGSHAGDLPNLMIGQDGIVAENWPLAGSARGAGGLLDGDGAAFVIHARADDELSDPSGNSGARIACAVLTPAT